MSSQIPGYQVVRKIGNGGMSSVYLAIQFSIGREVALKVLSPELRDDLSFAERFYREANIVGALSHPNVISIYDIGKHNQHYFMAMDYLPGPSCSDLVKDGQLSAVKSVHIVKDIAQALAYVHEQGYIHCDIKPDNVLFRHDGTAVLTDFGIARELKNKSASNMISGTPHYMSPEQAQGKSLSESSDIYSLGVLFYELLTGKPPYTGTDAIDVAMKHVSDQVPTLPMEYRQLQPLINKMMHKRLNARFNDANEFIEALNYLASDIIDHEVIDLPLNLKMMFFIDNLKDKLNIFSQINQSLQFSAKHGLIYKNLDLNGQLPNLDQLSKTLDQHPAQMNQTLISSSDDCADTSEFEQDVIGRALEKRQARVIIPAMVSYLIIGLTVCAIAYPFIIDPMIDFINQSSEPTIRYID